MSARNTVLGAALSYAARGWPVFPISQRKTPMTEHGVLEATLDTATIRDWFRRWPAALAGGAR